MVGAGVSPAVGPGVIAVQGARESIERQMGVITNCDCLGVMWRSPWSVRWHDRQRYCTLSLTWCHDNGGGWREPNGWPW